MGKSITYILIPIASLIIVVLTIIFATEFHDKYFNKEHLYSISTTVTAIDRENDVVTVTEINGGNIWEFYGVEDWEVGDSCALTMYDNKTEQIFDDEIIRTTYCG